MRTQWQQLAYAAGITPSPRQLAWQQLEFYAFVHFGMNSFTNREWGGGSEPPSLWKAGCGSESGMISLRFARRQTVSCVVLGEHLPTGQRIEAGEIFADGRKIAAFTVVGHKRICRFAPQELQELVVKITSSRTEPTLRLLAVYQ